MNLEIIHISKMLAKLHWKSYKRIYSRWSIAYVCELMIMVIYVCVFLIWHVGEETFYFMNANSGLLNSYLENSKD